MAFLGCDVISTDQTEVLPLLMSNAERNSSRILQMNPGSGVLLNLSLNFYFFAYLIVFLFSSVNFPHMKDSYSLILTTT